MHNYKQLQLNKIVVINFILFYISVSSQAEHKYEIFKPPKLQDYVVPTIIKGNLVSFSGFLDGSIEMKAKTFFWHFPSESGTNATDPLIIWLQGDLGASSVEGLFENNGPFYVKTKGLHLRKAYWSKKFNLLYLDTSPGVGYSHANSERNYPRNMDELISNLAASLKSFFHIFNYLKGNSLYIAGDGFACVTITKLAKIIDSKYPEIKLKGLILENGFCDPLKATSIATHFSSLKIIESKKFDAMVKTERLIQSFLQQNKFDEAFFQYDKYIKGILSPYKTLFNNYTFFESSQNLLYTNKFGIHGNYTSYMMKDNIKLYLHIPKDLAYNEGKEVLLKMKGELMKNSMKDLGSLANKYRILMYYGQGNPEISPNSAYNMASSLRWCADQYFRDVEYEPLFVNNTLTGYYKDIWTGECNGSLTWILFLNVGKNIANYKPGETLDAINKFITASLSNS